MNKADMLKVWAHALAEAHSHYCNAEDGEEEEKMLAWKMEAETRLHTAIDAQQRIIDEQRAEIERLRGLIKRGLDVCDPRCDGDVEWTDAAIAAIDTAIAAGSPAELTPADVCVGT